MGQRQLHRLLKLWVVEAGIDPSDYSVEFLRRTKALHILKGTGDLQTVRALLGHARIESTARYLGLKTKAEPSSVMNSRLLTRLPRRRAPVAMPARRG